MESDIGEEKPRGHGRKVALWGLPRVKMSEGGGLEGINVMERASILTRSGYVRSLCGYEKKFSAGMADTNDQPRH
ncbi:MAG: hypothetical protein ABIR47_18100, partial [Candidatus Kapaibacterium sp.]